MSKKDRSIEITTKIGCSNMCRFCPQELLIKKYLSRTKKVILSFNDFKRFLSKVPKDVRIDFSGMVEPWLNKDCTKMLLYAYKNGYKKIAVFTTAVGMSVKDIEMIKSIPFDVFRVHLADGDDNTKIQITDEYINVVKKIFESNISNIEFMTMGRLNKKLKKIIPSSFIRKERMMVRGGNNKFMKSISNKGSITCRFTQWPQRYVLLPNGDVLLCCMDYGLENVLGNLLVDKYDDLKRSEVFTNVLLRQWNSKFGDVICRHCEMAVENKNGNNFNEILKNLFIKKLFKN